MQGVVLQLLFLGMPKLNTTYSWHKHIVGLTCDRNSARGRHSLSSPLRFQTSSRGAQYHCEPSAMKPPRLTQGAHL